MIIVFGHKQQVIHQAHCHFQPRMQRGTARSLQGEAATVARPAAGVPRKNRSGRSECRGHCASALCSRKALGAGSQRLPDMRPAALQKDLLRPAGDPHSPGSTICHCGFQSFIARKPANCVFQAQRRATKSCQQVEVESYREIKVEPSLSPGGNLRGSHRAPLGQQ